MSDTPEVTLPFEIRASNPDKNGVSRFRAVFDDEEITSESYKLGDGARRRIVAALWAKDDRLRNGQLLSTTDIVCALEAAEREADSGEDEDDVVRREVAEFADDDLIVELAWNLETGSPDFIVYDRATMAVDRAAEVETSSGTLIVPSFCGGIVTPGKPIGGNIYVPTLYDETGLDESKLREDVGRFIHRYVELPPGAERVAVEYVFLTWVFDGFDEVPYIAFRTVDLGRGKSRALETVGALCCRPTFCGGGSSAAAVRRLVDTFRGTLIADEFDGGSDTELTATITKILNQGFQKNRPLVCCVGEDNQPKAFTVFGPKVFALRKGFGDDATESRAISITMRQRTRDDIPLNLPREAFDREALGLRNRLLAWRFGNLGRIKIDPALADSTLEDRANQIGLPLLAVAADAQSRSDIILALKGQQADVAADRAGTFPAEVFETILLMYEAGGIVRPLEVANEINRRRAEEQGLTDKDGLPDVSKLKKPESSKTVGWAIRKELELPRAGRDGKGIKYRFDAERMNQLKLRYGMGETPSTADGLGRAVGTTSTTPPSPTPPNPLENGLYDSENAVGVVRVCSVVPGEGAGAAADEPTLDDDSDARERAAIVAAEAEAAGAWADAT